MQKNSIPKYSRERGRYFKLRVFVLLLALLILSLALLNSITFIYNIILSIITNLFICHRSATTQRTLYPIQVKEDTSFVSPLSFIREKSSNFAIAHDRETIGVLILAMRNNCFRISLRICGLYTWILLRQLLYKIIASRSEMHFDIKA